MNKKRDIKSKKINMFKQIKDKFYISFTFRLIMYIFLFIMFFCITIVIFVNSFSFVESKNINYIESSFLDYKVYLKDNDFYDSKYLEKDMLYVASLIDNILIDFNYNFSVSDDVSLGFNYKIVGKLSIMDVNLENSYFEKEYVLLDNKGYELVNNNEYKFYEEIKIDYDYYNSIANSFKTRYGVDTYSKLVVYLVVDKNSIDDEFSINNSSYMSIDIPLSQRAINISMVYKDIDNSSYLISKSDVVVTNVLFIVIAIILIIIDIFILIKIIRYLKLMIVKKSAYDKYISKLLNEYDRLIVETTTCPIINGDNVIVIDKFQELLDVRDNLKLPIMYYIVNKHQKCCFYILHENKIYLNIVKAVDLGDC